MYDENPEEALKLADEIIKNTYRTLMTRGMKGCYIYCEDVNLENYFKERVRKLTSNNEKDSDSRVILDNYY